MFNRKYIFNPGPFSIAMLVDPGVYMILVAINQVTSLLNRGVLQTCTMLQSSCFWLPNTQSDWSNYLSISLQKLGSLESFHVEPGKKTNPLLSVKY